MPRPSPETFPSTVVKPSDFDAYWSAVLAEAERRAVGADLRAGPDALDAEVDVFDVRFTSLDGLRIAAWYCRPAGSAGPLPGLMIVPGYVSEPLVPKAWAAQGYAALSLAPRGKLRSNAPVQPRLSRPADAQHHRSQHLRLPWLLRRRLAGCRRAAEPAGGRSGPRRRARLVARAAR